MIGLWTGVPRCGKTYSLVYRIAQKYCDKFGDTYRLKKDYVLITDIDNLQIDHFPLIDFITKDKQSDSAFSYICPKCQSALVLKDGPYGKFYSCSSFPNCKTSISHDKVSSLEKKVDNSSSDIDIKRLFSDSGFKSLREKYPDKRIVIVVDECQRYFHSKLYDRDIFYAFEYHGHYGIDIYLIAHNISKIPREIANCLEFETRLIPRRYALPGYFWYNEKQGFDVVGKGRVPKKQEIFQLYTSEHFSQGDKVHKPFTRYYFILIIMILFSAYSVYGLVTKWGSGRQKTVDNPSNKLTSAKNIQDASTKQIENKRKSINEISDNVSIDKNQNSILYTKEEYEYIPIPTIVTYSKNRDPAISVVYNGQIVPVSMYPQKVIVIAKAGNLTVFELRKKEEKKQPENFISFAGQKTVPPIQANQNTPPSSEKKTTVDSDLPL